MGPRWALLVRTWAGVGFRGGAGGAGSRRPIVVVVVVVVIGLAQWPAVPVLHSAAPLAL